MVPLPIPKMANLSGTCLWALKGMSLGGAGMEQEIEVAVLQACVVAQLPRHLHNLARRTSLIRCCHLECILPLDMVLVVLVGNAFYHVCPSWCMMHQRQDPQAAPSWLSEAQMCSNRSRSTQLIIIHVIIHHDSMLTITMLACP